MDGWAVELVEIGGWVDGWVASLVPWGLGNIALSLEYVCISRTGPGDSLEC